MGQRQSNYRRIFPDRRESGLALVEFAVLGLLTVLLMVAATDYSLAIYARQEIHSAARSGMEFALNRGYDPAGIKATILKSTGKNSGWRFVSIPDDPAHISISVKCACFGQVDLTKSYPFDPLKRQYAAPVDPNGATATTTQSCSLQPVCTIGSASFVQTPYAKVKVVGSYTPFFPAFWGDLTNGKLEMSATYIGKTYFVR